MAKNSHNTTHNSGSSSKVDAIRRKIESLHDADFGDEPSSVTVNVPPSGPPKAVKALTAVIILIPPNHRIWAVLACIGAAGWAGHTLGWW